MANATGIQEFFSEAANNWTSYFIMVNVLGGVTMALLQTAKDLLPVRRAFQRFSLRNWFCDAAVRAGKRLGSKVDAMSAESELLALVSNSCADAFYDQQPEDVARLLNAGLQVLLESPGQYPNLLPVVAAEALGPDLVRMTEPIPDPISQSYLDSRTRVLHQCQRAISAFQIATAFRWKWLMQLASLLLGVALAMIALSHGSSSVKANWASVIFTAVLTGFLAPVAKDLLAVLQKARGE